MKFQLLKTFWKISSRSLWRNKLFSFISIAGFTVGLTVFILLMTFVHNEMSYDSSHANKDRIYRAVVYTRDDNQYYGNFPLALALRMKETMPQIECAVNYLDKDLDIRINGQFTKEKLTFADPGFFRMFSFKTLAGNPNAFGNNPQAVFVTRAFAEKYFGRNNPLGKIISTKLTKKTLLKNNEGKDPKIKPVRRFSITEVPFDFIIEGIVENPPDNTSLKFNVLVPFVNTEKMPMMMFSREDIYPGEFLPTFFVMLRPGMDKSSVEEGFRNMVKPLIRNEAYKPELRLYPIERIHFSTEIGPFSAIRPIDPVSVLVLTIISFVILIIVSINYVNLTIAQSSHRYKEIGIRKVSGAARHEIIYQFISESFVIILISLVISFILSALMLPAFNSYTDKHLAFNFGWGSIVAVIIFLPAILSLLAGAYPAMVLSGLNTVKILKGTQKLSGSKKLAKIFVTIQFVLAIILISGAIILNSQYNFLIKSDMGYNKDNLLLIRTNQMFGRMIDEKLLWLYRNEVKNLPDVRSASMSNMVLGGNGHLVSETRFDYGSKMIFSRVINGDASMIPAMGFKLLEGRNFSPAYASDSLSSIIVNEEFVKQAGIKSPLGKSLKYSMMEEKDVQIVGVVKDFHFMPLQDKIVPAAIFMANNKSWNECIYVKISPKSVQKTISRLKQTWEKLIPGQVFDYEFLDNKLEDLYKNENRWRNIITYSSAVAIFFACMGLFGLIFYAAEKRTKEIGIRKVLGASTLSIIRSLVNEFIILIALAIVLGCSVSYYFANKWLKNFAYHIELNIWIFMAAGLLVTIIVMATLLIITLKVSSTNSAENLRYE